MLTETDLREIEQRMADVGAALCGLSSLVTDLSASFANMAGQMQQITFYLYGNGQTWNGTCPTYDPYITPDLVKHAQKVRDDRDKSLGGVTT